MCRIGSSNCIVRFAVSKSIIEFRKQNVNRSTENSNKRKCAKQSLNGMCKRSSTNSRIRNDYRKEVLKEVEVAKYQQQNRKRQQKGNDYEIRRMERRNRRDR